MDLLRRVDRHFSESIRVKQQAAVELAPALTLASELLVRCLLSDSKILCCGSAGSVLDAQRLAAHLLNRFERERPALPAVAIGADAPALAGAAADRVLEGLYARQIRALGQDGDILVTLSCEPCPAMIAEAVRAAHDRGITVIVMNGEVTGTTGNPEREAELLSGLLEGEDIEIRVPSPSAARVQEVHSLAVHCLCDLIDTQLFGGDET